MELPYSTCKFDFKGIQNLRHFKGKHNFEHQIGLSSKKHQWWDVCQA